MECILHLVANSAALRAPGVRGSSCWDEVLLARYQARTGEKNRRWRLERPGQGTKYTILKGRSH